MIPKSQKRKEEEFQEWLSSIEFVDDKGVIIPATLTEDTSDDPEGDRGQ